MYLDERSEFADDVTIPTPIARALLGDVIDLGGAALNPVVPGDVGQGKTPMYLVVQITTAVTSAGAATVAFELSSDAQAAIAVDGTATIHYSTAAIPKATLVVGYVAATVALPMQTPAYERYLGIIANVAAAALTAGKANAFLTLDPAKWSAYPDTI